MIKNIKVEDQRGGVMEKQLSFYEWFNVNDKRHLKAYRTLQETGFWPAGFIPPNVTLGLNWQVKIVFKIASAWIDEKLK